MATRDPQFLHVVVLDGRGGGRLVDPASVDQWTKDQGVLWVHIDVNDSASQRWLEQHSGVEQSVTDILLAGETRPRSHATEDGLLTVLRGVNTNPGQDPEDMVSIRIWIEKDRIITARRRQLMSVQDVRASLDEGSGPKSSGGFLTALVERLADRIGDYVDNIEERVGAAEDGVGLVDPTTFRQSLTSIRQEIAGVRRFLAPQRDALDRLYRHSDNVLSVLDSQDLLEEADRITRYLEDLDLARERTLVLREEFLGVLAQEQNQRMYVLSVVAAIFLPLTFVTGLLGMNVGGLPGLESPRGFVASIAIMTISALILIVYFRWKKWL